MQMDLVLRFKGVLIYQEIGEEVVKHSEPEDPNLLHVEEGESSRQSVGIQRLRLRGDWSDTGPNARPERERDTQREGSLTKFCVRHVISWLSYTP